MSSDIILEPLSPNIISGNLDETNIAVNFYDEETKQDWSVSFYYDLLIKCIVSSIFSSPCFSLIIAFLVSNGTCSGLVLSLSLVSSPQARVIKIEDHSAVLFPVQLSTFFLFSTASMSGAHVLLTSLTVNL